jgi:DNA-binding transcriptional MerR regulator
MPDAGEEVLAFPDTEARRLAGVSMRRLRYWEQVGLIVPSIKRRLSDHNTVRLYSYQNLLALLVVSALRTERDMSLQTIRSLGEQVERVAFRKHSHLRPSVSARCHW